MFHKLGAHIVCFLQIPRNHVPKQLLLVPFLIFLLSACSLPVNTATIVEPAQNIQPAIIPTKQATATVEVSPTFTPEPTLTPTPTATSTPSPIPSLYECNLSDSTKYNEVTASTNINYEQKTVTVDEILRFTNQTEATLHDLVLDVEANHLGRNFTIMNLTTKGEELKYDLNQNSLTIQLSEALEPGCQISLELSFGAAIPPISAGITSFRGFFGYSERQINLAHWLPVVVPRQNGQWVIHEPIQFGEQIIFEQSDWNVTIEIIGDAPELTLAAPGIVNQMARNRWQVKHIDARDLAISLSPVFDVRTQETSSGVVVEVYTFPDAQVASNNQLLDGAEHALRVATESLTTYENLFGAYPYDRLLIIQGDFPDGMEFAGLVFVSTAWFYYFDGTYANFLTLITSHEVSHQWWYTQVGNDAALSPWLDEALSTYSEYLYLEEHAPTLLNWWWSFRVAGHNPEGSVDSTIYDFDTFRAYINAIYLRGVQMLHQIRDTIGEEAFKEILHNYVETGKGQIVTDEAFWSLFTPEQFDATAEIRNQFLINPDPIRNKDLRIETDE